ncbi:class I adenylate-forming enzyme family protein [Nitratireductor kimnyeongensis]|uniref:Class I adenylate-forming enzyme family protein n=1 Tax=Nitratireductor kimnyeongensis TaxID=430679 RepID=A0ABW0T6Y7_9HYPH|nr:AMP-binding protein [Nitratireductor kimnyeongensis]QZZ34624.1 AMP-binding protein [Nitratireductor kimnyeongensis]
MRPDAGGLPFFLSDIVSDNARWAPDATALIFGDQSWTWRQFHDETRRLQQGLARLGVSRGSRVAVLDRNSADYVLLGYALAGMGAVLVPINMWLRAAEVGYILGNCQPSYLVASEEFLDLASAALEELSDKPRIILRGASRQGMTDWSSLSHDGPEIRIEGPQSPDDPHLILYTSGTTGRPKGAIISHRRSVVDALNVLNVFGIRRFERFFCYMPLFHTGAWDYLKLYFMMRGSAVIAERFEAESAVEAIAAHRCNGMFGVPMVMRQMMESPAWNKADLSSMRLIAYANYDPSTLILKIVEAFRERGASEIGIANAYGLTEGGPYICINPPGACMRQPLAIGFPVPGTQVALLDDQMNEVPHGEIGEICVRSPALMSGYLNRPEATVETFAGGWLHTGDLGRVDPEGYIFLVDRKKDMIRSGGENIYAKEVELCIVSHPGVRDCAVFGVPDNDYGEKVVAAIVRERADLTASEITSFVRKKIAGFKTPRLVIFLKELPKTPAGKIKKHEIRKQLADAAD